MVSTRALWQTGIDVEIEPRGAPFDPAQNQVLDRVVADSPKVERLAHGAVNVIHLEGFQQPQNLHVFPFALLAHPCFQQPAQGGELLRQIPAFERCRLIQRTDLPLQQRQEMHRIEDHICRLI